MSLFYHMTESQKVEEITMKWPVEGYVIPAGTPMSRTGVANNGDAIGILASEARVRFPYPLSVANKIGKKEPKGTLDYEFSVITGGFVNRTEAEAAFGDTYSDAAISAMSGISFVTPESAKLGGSSLKKYTAEKTDGGYLVYGEPKPLLPDRPTLEVFHNFGDFLMLTTGLDIVDANRLMKRTVVLNGEKYVVTQIGTNDEKGSLYFDRAPIANAGDIIYPAPEPVPASELTAALASGTVQLECDGETINIGTWTAVEDGKITGGAGGVTSWNDLPDRPFGEEVKKTVLVDTVLQIPDPEDSGPGCGFVREYFNFKEGQTYTVTWDGVKHDCVAFKDNSNDTWLSTFENRFPDSEEVPDGHVLIDNNNKDSMCNFWLYVWGTNGEHTLKIEQTFESITPIDEKYLPESVSPLIGTVDSDEETGMPIVEGVTEADIRQAVADRRDVRIYRVNVDGVADNIYYLNSVTSGGIRFSTVIATPDYIYISWLFYNVDDREWSWDTYVVMDNTGGPT